MVRIYFKKGSYVDIDKCTLKEFTNKIKFKKDDANWMTINNYLIQLDAIVYVKELDNNKS